MNSYNDFFHETNISVMISSNGEPIKSIAKVDLPEISFAYQILHFFTFQYSPYLIKAA